MDTLVLQKIDNEDYLLQKIIIPNNLNTININKENMDHIKEFDFL